MVLQRILEIYQDDIGSRQVPNYNRIVKQKELFGANLSYKNLSGDEMVNFFFKKLVTNQDKFAKLVELTLDQETGEVYN